MTGSWDAGSEPTNNIHYTIDMAGPPMVIFTFPDGKVRFCLHNRASDNAIERCKNKSSQGVSIS
jgi:hypothetical protein